VKVSALKSRIGASGLESIIVVSSDNPALTEADVVHALGPAAVVAIEPDYYLELHGLPADELFDHQWALRNSGQQYYAVDQLPGEFDDTLTLKSGVPGADINMLPFYSAPPQDTTGVVVAILDTGSDLFHPDLSGRFRVNADEIPGNGLDDDHNGYVDDTLGYDFSGDDISLLHPIPDNDPSDDEGHGTHLAGIIAANSNTIGVTGIAPWVEILPVKIFPNSLSSVAAEGTIYAVNSGARVINMSFGQPFQSFVLQEALAYARANGVFVVASIGNDGTDDILYPAGFDETFAVGAVNSSGNVTSFSSWGNHIELVAPGQDILSLRAAGTDLYAEANEPGSHIVGNDENYYLSNGTSMAAPMVAGAAALLWSFRPDVSIDELEAALRTGAEDLVDPWSVGDTLIGFDSISGHGLLDIGTAYQTLGQTGLYFVTPRPMSREESSVEVRIAPANGYSGSWELAWAIQSDNPVWTIAASGVSPPPDSVAHTFAGELPSGLIILRLTDETTRQSITSFIHSSTNRLEVVSPVEGQQLEYSIPIIGFAHGPTYDSVTVELYQGEQTDPSERFVSTREYFDSLMTVWNLSGTLTGDFTVVMSGFFGDSTGVRTVHITMASTFAVGWPQRLTGRPAQSPIIADLDRDGSKELIIGTAFGLHVLSSQGQPRPGFPVLAEEDMRGVPAVYDLDRDGSEDIICTNIDGIHAFSHDGQYVAGFPISCFTGDVDFGYPTPAIVRLGGTVPDSAIVIVNGKGQVLAYDFQGNPHFYSLGGWFADYWHTDAKSYIFGGNTVTSADLNGNGRPEVITTYSAILPFAGTALYDGRTGLPAFDQPEPYVLKSSVIYGSILSDLNADDLPEIITLGYDETGNRFLWVKTLGNQDFPGWPKALPNLKGWVGNIPTVADLDRNGTPEIICSLFEFDIGVIHAFNFDGTPYVSREGRPPGELFLYPMTLGTPMVADLTGDEYPEIALRGGHILPGLGPEQLIVLDHEGFLVPGFPIVTPNRSTVLATPYAPAIDDLDGDGLVELALVSDNNDVYVWDFQAASHDGQNRARLYGDLINSNFVRPFRVPTDVSDGGDIELPTSFNLSQNYPNPFNPTTNIEFALRLKAHATLDVFNILGRKVARLVDEVLPAGVHSVEFDGSRFASGVYLYRLTAGDNLETRKMVLVK
jgi:subtilisin family serine protease